MGYRRARERKRRLKKLYEETQSHYGVGAYYDPERELYIKIQPCNSSGYRKTLRKISNRKVRRMDMPAKGCQYKKAYDYWWILF